MAWWLFVNKLSWQAVAIMEPPFDVIQEMESRGHELQWDSAPSEQAAYDYAEKFCNGYRHACSECGNFIETNRVTGQRYSDAHGRWNVISCRRMCGQCIDSGTELGLLKIATCH